MSEFTLCMDFIRIIIRSADEEAFPGHTCAADTKQQPDTPRVDQGWSTMAWLSSAGVTTIPELTTGGDKPPPAALVGEVTLVRWPQKWLCTAKLISPPCSPWSFDKHRNAITRTLAAAGLNTLMAENESVKTAQITLTQPPPRHAF